MRYGAILMLLLACGEPMLTPRPALRSCLVDAEAEFPALLAETGCFDREGQPTADLVPYEVASPLWTDGAEKERFVVVSPDAILEGELSLPVGSALIKTFALRTAEGRHQKVETRVMLLRADGWDFATYRWVDQTRAERLPDAGLTESIAIVFEGETRDLEYTFPDRGSCTACHGATEETLGWHTEQLDTSTRYGDQLATFADIGLVSDVADHQPLPDPSDERLPLELRARSYLHANCSHCHRPGGFAPAEAAMDLRIDVPLEETGLCDPMMFWHFAGFARIEPGAPESSGVLMRFTDETLPMPPIGTRIPNPDAVDLLVRWISSLDRCP